MIDGHRAQGNPLETILRHDVFVKLTDASVKAGDRIHVEVAWNVTSSAQDALLTFRPERTFTSVLHIDEYGYLADQDSKEMYLFCWMGDYPGCIRRHPVEASASSLKTFHCLPGKPSFQGVQREGRQTDFFGKDQTGSAVQSSRCLEP